MEEKRQEIPRYLDYVHISADRWVELMTIYAELEDRHNYKDFADWIDRSALKENKEMFYTQWSARINDGNTDL